MGDGQLGQTATTPTATRLAGLLCLGLRPLQGGGATSCVGLVAEVYSSIDSNGVQQHNFPLSLHCCSHMWWPLVLCLRRHKMWWPLLLMRVVLWVLLLLTVVGAWGDYFGGPYIQLFSG